jgi:hypothetical protein
VANEVDKADEATKVIVADEAHEANETVKANKDDETNEVANKEVNETNNADDAYTAIEVIKAKANKVVAADVVVTTHVAKKSL